MRLLLDTHVFLWLDAALRQLPRSVTTLLEDEANTILLSYASIWEMQIKHAAGKLRFSTSLQTKLESQSVENRISLFPIELAHIFALDRLPLHHRDPFDRMLIAQAYYEGIAIVSSDAKSQAYPISVIW